MFDGEPVMFLYVVQWKKNHSLVHFHKHLWCIWWKYAATNEIVNGKTSKTTNYKIESQRNETKQENGNGHLI